MPELPEVETTMRGLAPFVVGQRLVLARAYRENLRFAIPADFQQAMQGQRVERLERRAKYLLWHLSNQRVMLMVVVAARGLGLAFQLAQAKGVGRDVRHARFEGLDALFQRRLALHRDLDLVALQVDQLACLGGKLGVETGDFLADALALGVVGAETAGPDGVLAHQFQPFLVQAFDQRRGHGLRKRGEAPARHQRVQLILAGLAGHAP